MPTELPKNYDPSVIEPEASRVWAEENLFHAEPSDPGEPYCIVIPPPNVTGALHLGHALNNTIQDVLIRQHRMRGFNTTWIPGLDHAGIATQAVVEKQLKEKENKTRHDVGREGLVERIWAWKEQFGDRILSQLQRIGCSCDWSRTRFTLDDICARAVRETFFKLFKDGLIYRGKRLVNWDTFLQTSISDDEIYHETVKTHLWHINYPIEGTSQHLTVATTRPETLLGDTAVAVHSQDPRWSHLIGRQVRLPLTDRLIPIIADDILVDPKFGTGVVKVTPAHDPNDYAVWQRHKGKSDEIDLINILAPDGRLLNDPRWQPYVGMKRDAARAKVVEDLKAAGLLEKEEPYETQVGHSDRSKTAIEPYLSDQWFVKMAPLAEPALGVVREQTIKFFPERFAKTYLDWLGEKRDWPISRQLWWGHRIPVWSLSRLVNESITPIEEMRTKFAHWEFENRIKRIPHILDMTVGPDSVLGPATDLICIRNLNDTEVVTYLERVGYRQDPDVLDTWFSSALWTHSTLGWPEQTAELKKWYPTSVLVTSRDIITLWVARMVMTGLYNMGEIPFAAVHIHATILDGKGERMSKSKGNGVDPVDIIETHGADALRFTLMQMATETQDARLPVKKDAKGRNTSDKFDVGKHFCNKIWQVSQHFVIANLEKCAPTSVDAQTLSLADRWVISRFNRTVEAANVAIETYRFDQYAKACNDFVWGDFCDWYVEASKPALRDPQRSAQTVAVLAAVLDGALRLLHPVIPFMTEVLWWRLNEARAERGLPGLLECPAGKRLIKAAWPAPGPLNDAAEAEFAKVQETIAALRNIRTQYNINSPKQAITVSIAASGDLAQTLTENRELIETLALCKLESVQRAMIAPVGATHVTAAGCDLYVHDLINPAGEKKLNEKRGEELRKQIAALMGRLSNEAYTAKAPAHLVQQTRDQLAEAQAELAKITSEKN